MHLFGNLPRTPIALLPSDHGEGIVSMGEGIGSGRPITAANNFEDFPHALLLLFGISSGEFWDGYMKVTLIVVRIGCWIVSIN